MPGSRDGELDSTRALLVNDSAVCDGVQQLLYWQSQNASTVVIASLSDSLGLARALKEVIDPTTLSVRTYNTKPRTLSSVIDMVAFMIGRR